jgi:7-carboxy-7-deazaguanine synthase
MKLNEIFYSIQGEGKTIGQPRLFIRLSGCNLNCIFCDSKYHKESRELNNEDEELLKEHKHWCITGGEPLLQQDAILDLIRKYNPEWVEIETNGTIIPKEYLLKRVDLWNISPKGELYQKISKNLSTRIFNVILKDYIIKLVYINKNDDKFIKTYEKYGKERIYIMPEGATIGQLYKRLYPAINYCLKNNYNLSPRLHVMIWDKERGI